jgi:hypothetical protein
VGSFDATRASGEFTEMTGDELKGWKAIAVYLGVSVRTVQRWNSDLGMPVHRLPGETRGNVFARVCELVEWRAAIDQRLLATSDPDSEAETTGRCESPCEAAAEVPAAEARQTGNAPVAEASGQAATPGAAWLTGWRTAAIVVLLASVVVTGWVSVMRHPTAPAQAAPAARGPLLPPDGSAAAVGGAMRSERRAILVLSDDDGSHITVHVQDGAMASVSLPSLARFGITTALGKDLITLGITRLEVINRRGSIGVVGLDRLKLKKGVPASLGHVGLPVRIEWTGEDTAMVEPGHPDDDAHRCCLTCQPLTVCGQQVNGPCGSCRAAALLGPR